MPPTRFAYPALRASIRVVSLALRDGVRVDVRTRFGDTVPTTPAALRGGGLARRRAWREGKIDTGAGRRRVLRGLGAAAAAPAAALVPSAACAQRAPALRLGVVRFVAEAHHFVADARGMFAKAGLNAELKVNAYGAQSLRALFAAEVDVATVAALPVVYAAMSQSAGASDAPPPFRIIANLLRSSQLNNVVARGDRSILAPRDLNGRSIALTRGTASEYFWAMFVLANGIDRASVRVVDAAPPDLLAALHDGKVDAIVAWEPLVSDLRENARFPVVVLTSPEAYITAWISVVRADRLAALSGRLERYLSALLAAEQWIATDPDAAVAVHSARIGVPPARLAGIYREVNFAMSLDEGLIHNLELQSLWASEQGRAGGLPDYRAMVASRLLARVKPGSVGLLR